MGRFQSGAAVVVVSLLLFLACDVSGLGDPSSSTSSKACTGAHAEASLGTSKVTGSYCDDSVQVSQDEYEGRPVRGPPGLRDFDVTISNKEFELSVCDVHIFCGDLSRISPGDCIVRNGGAMAPGDTINFDYSGYSPIPFEVTSVSCCPPA